MTSVGTGVASARRIPVFNPSVAEEKPGGASWRPMNRPQLIPHTVTVVHTPGVDTWNIPIYVPTPFPTRKRWTLDLRLVACTTYHICLPLHRLRCTLCHTAHGWILPPPTCTGWTDTYTVVQFCAHACTCTPHTATTLLHTHGWTLGWFTPVRSLPALPWFTRTLHLRTHAHCGLLRAHTAACTTYTAACRCAPAAHATVTRCGQHLFVPLPRTCLHTPHRFLPLCRYYHAGPHTAPPRYRHTFTATPHAHLHTTLPAACLPPTPLHLHHHTACHTGCCLLPHTFHTHIPAFLTLPTHIPLHFCWGSLLVTYIPIPFRTHLPATHVHHCCTLRTHGFTLPHTGCRTPPGLPCTDYTHHPAPTRSHHFSSRLPVTYNVTHRSVGHHTPLSHILTTGGFPTQVTSHSYHAPPPPHACHCLPYRTLDCFSPAAPWFYLPHTCASFHTYAAPLHTYSTPLPTTCHACLPGAAATTPRLYYLLCCACLDVAAATATVSGHARSGWTAARVRSCAPGSLAAVRGFFASHRRAPRSKHHRAPPHRLTTGFLPAPLYAPAYCTCRHLHLSCCCPALYTSLRARSAAFARCGITGMCALPRTAARVAYTAAVATPPDGFTTHTAAPARTTAPAATAHRTHAPHDTAACAGSGPPTPHTTTLHHLRVP